MKDCRAWDSSPRVSKCVMRENKIKEKGIRPNMVQRRIDKDRIKKSRR